MGIASRPIQIHIPQPHEAQKHIRKSDLRIRTVKVRIPNVSNLLDFIQENIVLLCSILHLLPDKPVQFQRIAVSGTGCLIQSKFYDMVVPDTYGIQIFMVQPEKEK